MALPTTYPSKPTPQEVGRAFVEQYYFVFQNSPDLLSNFYQDKSILSRPDANGVMTSVTTTEAINDLVLKLASKNPIICLETVDSQASPEDGVFILVTGCFVGGDWDNRKFAQTFLLANQGGGLYVVYNDVFRFLDESVERSTDQVPVNGNDDEAVKIPATADQGFLEDHHAVDSVSQTKDADSVSQIEDVDSVSQTKDVEHVKNSFNHKDSQFSSAVEVISADPVVKSIQIEAPSVPETSTAVALENVPKKSYASIVKEIKAGTSSVSVPSPAATVKPTTASSVKPSNGIAKPDATKKPVVAELVPDATKKPVVAELVPPPDVPATNSSHSIYVRNLPLNTAASQVEEVFKQFGAIKSGGVQVRNHKIEPFSFGFVEFDSLISMQAAIKASPVMVCGRKAFVEEKKTLPPRVVNGGSGRGRYPAVAARGGFRRNDNFGGFREGSGGGLVGNQGYFAGAGGDFRDRRGYHGRGGGRPNASRGQYYRPVSTPEAALQSEATAA